MIDNIADVLKRIKDTTNDPAMVLKMWANTIIDECSDIAVANRDVCCNLEKTKYNAWLLSKIRKTKPLR